MPEPFVIRWTEVARHEEHYPTLHEALDRAAEVAAPHQGSVDISHPNGSTVSIIVSEARKLHGR